MRKFKKKGKRRKKADNFCMSSASSVIASSLWLVAQPACKRLHQPFLKCTAQLKALVVVVLRRFSPQQL
jgi:hypothetical protein